MNFFKPHKILFGVMAVAMLALYSCKSKPLSIFGTWVTNAPFHKGEVYRETYLFLTDSTFRLSYTIADSVSGKDLGYRYASSGRFSFKGEHLKLYKMISISDTMKNSDYVVMPRLKFIKEDSIRNYSVKVNPGDTSFYFTDQPCPPFVNCKSQLIYIKKLSAK
jgi:hypothetical protein